MDYPYENLNPEKFQLFCQALLVKEYPGVQCFPVAQPDGGRDATQIYFDIDRGKEFAMFQVKYVRNPFLETDPHKWLAGIIASEAPKVKIQIRAGAKFFVLMTNIPGTAHLDSGSIDIVNKKLTEELGIKSICLWRNDLSRRLDSAWDLKWAYPELMTGPDLIRLIIESSLSESKERRASAVHAFVTTQYGIDQYVKFKQVDLDNRLLDLFIDVPINFSQRSPWHTSEHWSRFGHEMQMEYWSHNITGGGEESILVLDERMAYARRMGANGTGAATFALSQAAADDFPFAVIEGAPGQGKSTITQYICQVHRMRLLNKRSDLSQIPQGHQTAPVRLPIKVDLRDFAAWLIRRNPFTPEAEEIPIAVWNKSLESFLAALIRYQSGGAQFDVSDLQAVIRLSAVLLVMDGLDEVADIKRRADVVAEIVKGAERLKDLSASFQVIVTSRPAAFENSPGLPRNIFRYLSLNSVTQELIDEYATKWLKARRLVGRESSDVKRILKDKLSQPHIRDLARNPMQLAILLILIHTRGFSLPDKRTALYDSYIDLFFDRESEKSDIVRDNRELLIDIHRYLAWKLHVESEQSGDERLSCPAGAIEENRLKSVLRIYLDSEGRDPNGTDLSEISGFTAMGDFFEN
ncbi:MAG: hypothetical protein ABIS50_01285 [Luteolibacter sp.]|uniref:NACHT domain-containing protein n=1 Tax=Luteolibacter sp. TaxID=1962973 RepID=UPI0032679BCE